MWPFKKKSAGTDLSPRLAARVRLDSPARRAPLPPVPLWYSSDDYVSGRFRTRLYRYLTDTVPVIDACVMTWARLSAAPGMYIADTKDARAQQTLDNLATRLFRKPAGGYGNLASFLVELFNTLYRDGLYGAFVLLRQDASGLDRVLPVDTSLLSKHSGKREPLLELNLGDRTLDLRRDDFYYIPLNADGSHPLGRSMLHSIPFVAYIEQQLVDDMRRTSHNAGYHRLHVKVHPPERMGGESETAYIERINSYFDSTVGMIRSCEVDENPVTWDDVTIEHIGPQNVRAVTNSWFMNHRAMVEEICAGTNLAPFLLGYSYGATSSWSAFKFDLVMRQVQSVQAEVAAFLTWLGDIELSLAGLNPGCSFRFDNTLSYQANEDVSIRAERVANIVKLYEAGLVDKETARKKAEDLL